MDGSVLIIVCSITGVISGALLTYFVLNGALKSKKDGIIEEAKKEGETLKEKKILQAKEKFLEMKSQHDREVGEKNNKVKQAEDRIKNREREISQQQEQLKRKEKEADAQKENATKVIELNEKKSADLEKSSQKIIAQLEDLSKLSADDARAQLMDMLKEEARNACASQIQGIVDEAKLKANQEAKKIVIQTIQRTAVEHAVENSVSVFNIENDEIKGRIIGREGRNIRALEAATGVEIIVDDTPEAIVLSCFDPVRREIARLSLHQLVTDGRIHPARIEEVVAKVSKNIEEEIVEVGKRTCIEMGIHGLHSELVRMVGRMKYRSSYGQNLLQHSREVANLCATMASELGLNPKAARRAGLLHDIGKVPDTESELPHAVLGMKLAEKYGEKPDVCNAIGAHHDEVEMTTLLSPIIQVCDAISGARPGARREVVEAYIQRLRDLENLALEYPGVSKSFAIQAGRELRVMVEADHVTDDQADALAISLASRIETEMTYPGQVRVTVIREKRAEYPHPRLQHQGKPPPRLQRVHGSQRPSRHPLELVKFPAPSPARGRNAAGFFMPHVRPAPPFKTPAASPPDRQTPSPNTPLLPSPSGTPASRNTAAAPATLPATHLPPAASARAAPRRPPFAPTARSARHTPRSTTSPRCKVRPSPTVREKNTGLGKCSRSTNRAPARTASPVCSRSARASPRCAARSARRVLSATSAAKLPRSPDGNPANRSPAPRAEIPSRPETPPPPATPSPPPARTAAARSPCSRPSPAA